MVGGRFCWTDTKDLLGCRIEEQKLPIFISYDHAIAHTLKYGLQDSGLIPQLFLGALQFLLPRLELFVNLDGPFVGRNQQVQNLLSLRGDEMPLAAKVNLHPQLHFFGPAQLPVR